MYKIGQKRHPAAACWVTRAGVEGAVVMGSNPAKPMNFFSFPLSKNFGGLVTGTPNTKFPLPVPVL